MAKNDEDENVVMRSELKPALTSLYEGLLPLCSTAGWSKPKLGVKRYRSEKNGTMYLRTTLMTWKTRESILEARAGAGAHNMKAKDVLVETELAAFSAPSEKRRTATSRLVNEMPLLCSIYVVELGNMAEEHEIDVEKELSGKVGLVLA